MSDTVTAIRTKFEVQSITEYKGGTQEVKLAAVMNDAPENRVFSLFTPSGDVRLSITNPNAIGVFEPGDQFFVDLIKVEQPVV